MSEENISQTQSSKTVTSSRQQLSFAVDLLTKYNPDRVTPSTHLEQWIYSNTLCNDDDNEIINFLENIFYGIERRRENVHKICKRYYKKHARQTLKEDYNLYLFFIYLFVFHKKKMKFAQLKSLIIASDPTKMVNLCHFIFDECLQNKSIQNQLSQSLDYEYVRLDIIEPMQLLQPQIKKLCIHISEKNLLRSTALSKEINFEQIKECKITKPAPFKLTKSLPKPKPKKEALPQLFKSKKVPKSIYKTNVERIENEKKIRKEQIKKQTTIKYEKSHKNQFEFETAKRPLNIGTIRDAVNEKIEQSMISNVKPKQIPNFNKNCPVRMTTATILREDALFQKEQQKEAKLLKEYECGLLDSTEFDEWKENELMAVEIEKVRLIAERKKEMQQSAVLAKEAVKSSITKKYISAQKMNLESMKTLKIKKESDRRMLCQKVEIAQKIKADHENALNAVKEHEAQNKEIRDNVKEQTKQNEIKKKEEKIKELKKKKELIAKIQEMEKRAMEKIKASKEAFDRNTSSKVGLFAEMSINELEKKIEKMNAQYVKEQAERRQNILAKKEEKHMMILMKARNLSKRRVQKRNEQKAERAKKMAQLKQIENERKRKHDDTVLAMAQSLKNSQRLKLEKTMKEKEEIKKVLAMQKEWKTFSKQIEKLNWMNYNDGLERIAKNQQKKKFIEDQRDAQRRNRLKEQRKSNLNKTQNIKQSIIKKYDSELTKSQKMSKKIEEKENETKKARFEMMRQMKKNARSKYLERKPYEQKMETLRSSKLSANHTMSNINLRQQQYQLLNVSESQIEDMPLPNHRIKCNELNLFCWRKWISFAWIKFTYLTIMIFFILMFAMRLIHTFIDGNGWIIFGSLIFLPIFCILSIAAARIFTEVLLSILIIPHQLHQMTASLNQLRSAMPPPVQQQIEPEFEQQQGPMETR